MFSLGQTTQVGGVTAAASSVPGNSLPLTVTAGTHQTIVVTAGFTARDGGSAEVLVTSSALGSDSSRIRQLTSLPFRSGVFIVD
jgi:hypothetical protein